MRDLATLPEEFKFSPYPLDSNPNDPNDPTDADEWVIREKISRVWDERS